jgi:hypothetical protein
MITFFFAVSYNHAFHAAVFFNAFVTPRLIICQGKSPKEVTLPAPNAANVAGTLRVPALQVWKLFIDLGSSSTCSALSSSSVPFPIGVIGASALAIRCDRAQKATQACPQAHHASKVLQAKTINHGFMFDIKKSK